MESQVILDLIAQNKWVALSSVVIGTIVRLLKSDGPIPWEVPTKYRPWLAVGLGIVAGILDKIANGTPWKSAMAGGLVAAFLAMSGHSLFIQSARGGRELGESKEKFIKRSLPPPPPAPPTDPEKIDPPKE